MIIEVWGPPGAGGCEGGGEGRRLLGVVAGDAGDPCAAALEALGAAAEAGWGGMARRGAAREGSRLAVRGSEGEDPAEFEVSGGGVRPCCATTTRARARPGRPAAAGRPGLGVIDVVVTDASGSTTYDPNRMVVACVARPDDLLALVPMPGLTSDVSGRPAVLYETDQASLALAPDELLRLAGLRLLPHEARRLALTHGAIHEIHDDFYDWESGGFEALQPRGGDDA